MPLNLISDPWIPVRDRNDERRMIAPWQMADDQLLRPDWPRPDLNLGCLELLIGLVFLADPPENVEDWEDRQMPGPDRLRERLAPYTPAFELTGEGPRFLQDFEPLEGKPNSPDMLFIDSAGQQTARNNADLMVRRSRYDALSPSLAAMALYTLQAHAPAGGSGNRTSMRGGGPMVTLVDPQQGRGLWTLVWANTPYGQAADIVDLPWMKPTPTSEKKGSERWPQQGHPVETFFGMPRRLRLVEQGGLIVGVIQRRYGINYAGWVHSLTPYYRQKEGTELLPMHPRPGRFGYRNWLGVVTDGDAGARTQRGETVLNWKERKFNEAAELIVAGWAMDNMKPRDFTWSTPPLVNLSEDAASFLRGLIQAADSFGLALRRALAPVLAEGEDREAVRERFFSETQSRFEKRLGAINDGAERVAIARDWVNDLRDVALRLFETEALPGLADRGTSVQERIVAAHSALRRAFTGHGKVGAEAYGALEIEPVHQKKREEAK